MLPASAPAPHTADPGPSTPSRARRLSRVADALVGSEILAIAAEIRARVAAGVPICNLTVGDFNPAEFRIPALLEQETTRALAAGETNYPPSNGLPGLRAAISALYRDRPRPRRTRRS